MASVRREYAQLQGLGGDEAEARRTLTALSFSGTLTFLDKGVTARGVDEADADSLVRGV